MIMRQIVVTPAPTDALLGRTLIGGKFAPDFRTRQPSGFIRRLRRCSRSVAFTWAKLSSGLPGFALIRIPH